MSLLVWSGFFSARTVFSQPQSRAKISKSTLQTQWRQSRQELARVQLAYKNAFAAMRSSEAQIVATRARLRAAQAQETAQKNRFAARIRAVHRAQNPTILAFWSGQARLDERVQRRHRHATILRFEAQSATRMRRETTRLTRQINAQSAQWAARDAFQKRLGARRAALIESQKRFAALWKSAPKTRESAPKIRRQPREVRPEIQAEAAPQPRETRREITIRRPEKQAETPRRDPNRRETNRREKPRRVLKTRPQREFVREVRPKNRVSPPKIEAKTAPTAAPKLAPRLAPRVEVGPRYAPRVDLNE